MIVNNSHLSWCLNIYPGESWSETYNNVVRNAPEVKRILAANELSAAHLESNGLGLGMRISDLTAKEMPADISSFKEKLNELGLYVYTVNAFPFGNFHIKPVKQKVYYPDWSSQERVDYTVNTAKILAQLVPDGTYGSISTVPVTYGKELPENSIKNLIKTAKELKRIEESTGKVIKLALEPEPDCYLERTDEAINFFNILRNENKELAERYLGICLDTCHMALQFEKPIDSLNRLIEAEVPIPKIQISSVFTFDRDNFSNDIIRKYNEEVYLHQTLVKNSQGVTQFSDLGDALAADPDGEWRVHFHVPLYFTGDGQGIGSTSNLLDEAFMKRAFQVCDHLETETYTYDVLPGAEIDVNESIAKEILYVLQRLT
jgi:sugar phosphate isomerase/epimerase